MCSSLSLRCPHLEKGPRLWHAAASPEPSQVDILEDYCPGSQITSIQVMVVGGLTNNILAPHYVEKEHAEKVSQAYSLYSIYCPD